MNIINNTNKHIVLHNVFIFLVKVMSKEYYTLINDVKTNNYKYISSYMYEEKKSKFICYIFNISNENEAKDYIEDIKNNNKSARHVVYIYSVKENNNINIRFSDDGEPQGTGIKTIYENLQNNNITNVCIVIVRYFGGVLLGAGPLLRAYFKAFKGARDKCKIEKLYNYIEYNFYTTYSNFDFINSVIKLYEGNNDIKNLRIDYNENIEIKLEIKEELLDSFKQKILNYIIT